MLVIPADQIIDSPDGAICDVERVVQLGRRQNAGAQVMFRQRAYLAGIGHQMNRNIIILKRLK